MRVKLKLSGTTHNFRVHTVNMGKPTKAKASNQNDKKSTTKTQSQEKQSKSQNEATCSNEMPNPDSFNGAELTMTQLYEIIRKLSSEICETKKADFETKVTNMQLEIQDLKKAIKTRDRSIEKLEWEKQCQDKQIQQLNTKIDQLEQQQYHHDVKIIGLDDTECGEEEEREKLIKFASETLDMRLKSSDIVQLQRLGKRSEIKPTRSLVVRFKKLSTRQDFYQRRKKTFINVDPKKNVYINDRVTNHRSNLLYAARKLVKTKKIHSAWTQHGNVMIRKTETDSPEEILLHEDLTQFKDEHDWMKDVIIEEVDTSDLPNTSDEED